MDYQTNAYRPMRRAEQRQSGVGCPDACGCAMEQCGVQCLTGKQMLVPAMAYVPDHTFDNLLTPEHGFCAGTIFGCLNLPFLGKEVR